MAVGATAISTSALQSAGTINEGTELTVAGLRMRYMVSASATIASNTCSIPIYPALEAAVASTGRVISIVKSTLNQEEEEWLSTLAAGRAFELKANLYPNAIPIGGGNVWQNFITLGQNMVGGAITEMRRSNPPKTTRRYSNEVI